MLDKKQIAAAIDHTQLKPGTLIKDIDLLCREAIDYGFAAVCVPPMFVKLATSLLSGYSVKVATVIGFPFGYSAVEAKLAEIVLAIVDGADELDVVINYTAIKNKDWAYAANEINHIMPLVKNSNKVVKVIIESGSLSDDEIIKCCELYAAAGVDFVKTSTGYAAVGATIEAVTLMRKSLPPYVQIKASGGIRTAAFAEQLLDAGATRIGCSSGVAIISGASAKGTY